MQESGRHAETLNAITKYLDMGIYSEWDEEKKLEFLTREFKGKRPLVPPSMEGTLRSTEQGEMVRSKFGLPQIAVRQLEVYWLQRCVHHTLLKNKSSVTSWRRSQRSIVRIYWSVVYKNPEFLTYFQEATSQAELGFLNIGSRPSRRKSSTGIGHLRAIPWVFAWTQTRFVLPAWVGVEPALRWGL